MAQGMHRMPDGSMMADSAMEGPRIGERRTAQGETREWTGEGWQLVSAPDEPSERSSAGYASVPGLVGGFLRGAMKGVGEIPITAGRLVHTIPGVTAGVDRLYGEPGRSAAAFNQAETALASQSPAETVGKVASYLIPSGAGIARLGMRGVGALRTGLTGARGAIAEGIGSLGGAAVGGQIGHPYMGSSLGRAIAKRLTGVSKPAVQAGPRIRPQPEVSQLIQPGSPGLGSMLTRPTTAKAIREAEEAARRNQLMHELAAR